MQGKSQTLFLCLQLWIDSSAGGALPAAAEKKETDFFAELTQVVVTFSNTTNSINAAD